MLARFGRMLGRDGRGRTRPGAKPLRSGDSIRAKMLLERLEERAMMAADPSPLAGFLTGPQAGQPIDIALNYLNTHSADYGLSGNDISRLFVANQYTDSGIGTTHIYLRQGYNGVPVFDKDINVNITADGSIVNVGGGFDPTLGTMVSSPKSVAPKISATTALADAAAALGQTGDPTAKVLAGPSGVDQVTLLHAPGVSSLDTTARLQYYVAPNGPRLVWEVPVFCLQGDSTYDAHIDAETGALLEKDNWTDHIMASYNVFSLDSRTASPDHGDRVIVNDPADPVASPYGWHNTGTGPTPTSTKTIGNNTITSEDTAGNDQIGFSPDGGAALNFNFPIDYSQDPSKYQSAAITNEFYWTNIVHDIWYHYGFDEAAGNFQTNNYNKGGQGNDAVLAQSQDGGGIDNANFTTPPDGTPGRMRMYLFDLTTPKRDGDLDPEVIAHESGHGLSNRLTGGAANSGALQTPQSRGMGEGWSDFWSLAFLVRPGDTKDTPRPVGTYLLGEPTTGGGIRRFPYSYNMAVDPQTIGDYNLDRSSNGSPEVHNTGELWCGALWDMHWNLVDKYGYDNDLYNGKGGNNLAIQLIIDGMKLQPANPTFAQARDAILKADMIRNGGDDLPQIWAAFARRGMGLSFDSGADSNAITVKPATDTPQFLAVKTVAVTNVSEHQAFNNVTVASLSDPNGRDQAADYFVTISWGDGQVTPATVVSLGKGKFDVRGGHTFNQGGSYPIKIQVQKTDGSAKTNASGSIVVRDSPILASGSTINLKEGQGSATPLATFTDTDITPSDPSAYSVTIHYGDDGTNAVGTVVRQTGGTFVVNDGGTHLYGGGQYPVTVTVTGPGGSTASATTTAVVQDSPLHSSGLSVTPTEGTAFSAPLASFTDEDPRAPGVSNYFATISWGDGTPDSTGTIVPNPAGPGFIVTGNHAYGMGSYGTTVTIGNRTGSNTTVSGGTADVADAPISSLGIDQKPLAGVTFKGILATFADTDPRPNPLSHYLAVVNWGDGSAPETGQVVINEDGGYLVYGTHAYRSGSYPITTTISDYGTSTSIATSNAVVPDAPIKLAISPAPAAEGVPDNGVVGSFSTPNLLARGSDYSASITWGDGTVSTGTVVPQTDAKGAVVAGSFLVLGNGKTYNNAGSYPISLVVTSAGGAQLQVFGSLTVTAAPISAGGLTFSGVSKTTLSPITVAHFTSANPNATAAKYTATITWGDGSTTPGSIVGDSIRGFDVVGGHRFTGGGTYNGTVTITGSGVAATVPTVGTITDLMTPISGGASTSSGGTISETGLTNSNTPVFRGVAEPFASVQVFAIAGSTSSLIGTGHADATGTYTVVSSPLADGQYTIMASASDSAGHPSSAPTVLYPTPSRGPLTVDTQGPKVSQVTFDPKTGRVRLNLNDALSGLGSGVLNASNYSLRSSTGVVYAVTGLTVSPLAPNTQQTVTLTFNTPKGRKGQYVLQLSSSGLTDRAGNSLDERYYVPFPGLYNKPGQDFIAAFTSNGKTSSQAQQYVPPAEVAAAQKHALFVRKHFARR